MQNLNDLDVNIVFGEHGATSMVSQKTAQKIIDLAKRGYKIFVGNNPHMDKAKKWIGRDLIKISQVNSRHHRWSIRTIWAVKE